MEKNLFAFDLDGTLLNSEGKLTKRTKSMVKRLRDQGHIVCILTGRPWKATEDIYNELGLDTVIGNYNGGHLHNPKNYDFVPESVKVPVLTAIRIINDENIKEISRNVIIENPRRVLSHKPLDNTMEEFLHNKEENARRISLKNFTVLPQGILIHVKKKYNLEVDQIRKYIISKYGDEITASYWVWGKDNEIIIDIVSNVVGKHIALIKMARYYRVDMDNVIVFGDGGNDQTMLEAAGVGVAMANARNEVKHFANVVTKHTNDEDGVAKFINWYFSKGKDKVDGTIYRFGNDNNFIKQVIED